MRPRKIVAIVFGALLVLIGLAVLVPGGLLLGAYGTLRDNSGFFETSSRVVSTPGYALVSPDVDMNIGPGGWSWIPKGARAAVRIRATSTGAIPLFIGIGPSDRVTQYLANVAHDELTGYGWMSASVTYRHVDGGPPSSLPGQQDFWVGRQQGTGSQTLEWDVQGGNWTAVVMNADGTAPVTANLSLGARFGILFPIALGMTIAGVVLLAVGIVLIVLGARRPHPAAQIQPPPGWGQSGWGPPPPGWGSPPAAQGPPPATPGPPPAQSGPPLAAPSAPTPTPEPSPVAPETSSSD
jgi:hypothetical protein